MITLDITGFYFSKEVDFTGQTTVQQVMEDVARQTAAEPTVFDFGPRLGQLGAKLNFIGVEFNGDPPRSRQVGYGGLGAVKADRKYFFDDSTQVLAGPTDRGQAQSLLAWQYYVTDARGRLKNGKPQSNTGRRVVPFSLSTPDYQLADGDLITWRLVAIFSQNAPSPALDVKATAGRA